MEALMNWWYEHNPREQMMIAVGGTCAALILFILFLVMPLLEWRDQEHKRLVQAKEEALEVQSLASKVLASKANRNTSNAGKGLAVVIDQSLNANNLEMRGFQPGRKKDARLRLENAAYPDLMQWLHDLEYRHKVSVEELSLTPAQTSGRLMVSIRVAE